MCCDYDEVVTLDDTVNNILEHLVANDAYYREFHTGYLLWNVEGYFKFGSYCNSVIDVITIATAQALHLNMSIFQEGPVGNLHVIEKTSKSRGRDVHWKFM